MAVNWNRLAGKVKKALKQDFPTAMTITVTHTSAYNITTGKAPVSSPPSTYQTHGAIKTFEVADLNIINPEEVEILFHSGTPTDSIPDLTNEKNITITAYGTIYKVKNIRAVRPAGVTLLYKAIAVESKAA